VKIQSAREAQLTPEEVVAVRKLKLRNSIEGEDENEENDEGLSFALRALKRQRMQQQSMSSGYLDTRFLLPTSNHVERLFSMSKRLFSTKRRRLLPRTLEALVFLKQNRSLWDLSLVASIVNEDRAEAEDRVDDPNDCSDDEESDEEEE
jgi:hypothetical protein